MSTARLRVSLSLLSILSLSASAAPSLTATGSSRNAVVTLVPEVGSIQPGKPLWIGLHIKLAPEWHTYWKNPGDAGLPTRIRWRLPEGFSAGEIQWPRPERIPAEPLMSYGYDNEVVLLTEIRTPAAIGAGELKIGGRVDWLECKEACLPGKAELDLTLPVANAAPRPLADWTEAFRKARERLPRSSTALKVEAVATGAELTLSFAGIPIPKQAYFFPAKTEVLEHAAPQKLVAARAAFRLQLTRAKDAPVPERIFGVLEADNQAYEVQAPVRAGATKAADAPQAAVATPGLVLRPPDEIL